MPKQTNNPNGRVSVDLCNDKNRLDHHAKASGTTATNVARILIRHGLSKLDSGEFKITAPTLASTVEGDQ